MPLRISFLGGGSDIISFLKRRGIGYTLGGPIKKYVYIFANKKHDSSIRLSYSKTENVLTADDLKHDIAKECLKYMGIRNGIEIASIADLPYGTGLGSSSSFTTALLLALDEFRVQYMDKKEYIYNVYDSSDRKLIDDACYIELNILNRPIGRQDQIYSVLPGFRLIEHSLGYYTIFPYLSKKNMLYKWIRNNTILVKVGDPRDSSKILEEQAKNKETNKTSNMAEMAKSAYSMLLEEQDEEKAYSIFTQFVSRSWAIKKELASSITNDATDKVEKELMKYSIDALKLAGAGGGGYFIVMAKEDVIEELKESFECIEIEPETSPMSQRTWII